MNPTINKKIIFAYFFPGVLLSAFILLVPIIQAFSKSLSFFQPLISDLSTFIIAANFYFPIVLFSSLIGMLISQKKGRVDYHNTFQLVFQTGVFMLVLVLLVNYFI